MKTDELIGILAMGARPVSPWALERRFAVAGFLGLLGAVLVMLLGYGVRPDLGQAVHFPMFWLKYGFAAALAASAALALLRLSRPGMPVGDALALVVLPPLTLWVLALVALEPAAPAERLAMVMGTTWRSCAFNIGLLSLPAFGALLWGLRQAAPTHLRLAGACAGLLAGALATLAYSLHCPEMRAPFLAVWYVLGIALPTGAGAVLGPRVLRW